jgi:hypothetical protein
MNEQLSRLCKLLHQAPLISAIPSELPRAIREKKNILPPPKPVILPVRYAPIPAVRPVREIVSLFDIPVIELAHQWTRIESGLLLSIHRDELNIMWTKHDWANRAPHLKAFMDTSSSVSTSTQFKWMF